MDFGFELFLLIRQQVDFDVRIGSASHVQSGQLLRLDHGHGQGVRVEVVFKLKRKKQKQIRTSHKSHGDLAQYLVLDFAQLLLALLALPFVVFLGILGQFFHVGLNLGVLWVCSWVDVVIWCKE